MPNKTLPYDKAKLICDVFGLDSNELLIVNRYEFNSDRIKLPEYVNEDFARLFGFLCGDGHISNGSRLSFSTSPDTELNVYYEKLLKQFFGEARFIPDKRSARELGKIEVYSTTACKILTEMGYINNHNINRIPEWVFNCSPNIRRAFVEGFSDADGCERHTKKGTWFSTIEISNKKMVEDLKELWNSIGLCSGHIKERQRNGGHMIGDHVAPPTTSYSVTISDCILPESENVLEVIPFGKENVYDIEVENELHNFIANGTPVHNSRAPERRIFYIDVQQYSPAKAEALVERMKDQLRKKKTVSRAYNPGASSVEERWHAPAFDEDFWIPTRPNSNTRIETLPGAQNLGEIDDTVYFRNKLYTALNFPKNYFNNEDTQATRISLSAQDVKFARMVERLQSHIEDAFYEICERHLKLLGYPEEAYEDLVIQMTPPSDWRELTKAEVITNRINNASTLKSAKLLSDYDILIDWMMYDEEKTREMIARNKMQMLEELKMQIIAQNPGLLGVGLPGPNEQEVGVEPGGPSPMLAAPQPPMGQPPMPDQGQSMQPPMGMVKYMDDEEDGQQPPPKNSGGVLPEPAEEDIRRFNLDIKDFEKEMDEEEPDFSENE
jgi:hypothetical protein